ncbi:MAG: hypothetical protein ACKVTZ_24020 [Bacteroidia bacterium]
MATESSRTQKFINYTKEAFFSSFHLVGMGIISATTVLATALPFADNLPVVAGILMAGVGAELAFLGVISRNDRFIRAINAKYQGQIDEYQKTKALVDYYNRLSQNAQQRFDRLKNTIKEVRDRYGKIGHNSHSLVDGFLNKLNSIEIAYVRLLFFKDKFPELANEQTVFDTQREMDALQRDMNNASGQLRELKEKRLLLLKKKMENFIKIRENKEIIEEKLQTFEDLVEYIKDQPMTMMQSDKDDLMIDNLLFDAEQTQESLSEIENLMRSEFNVGGGYDNSGYDADTKVRN